MPVRYTNETFDLKNTSKYKRIGNYEGSKTKIDFICPDCNTIWKATPGNVLKGSGCFKCSYKTRASTIPISNYEFDAKLKALNIAYVRVEPYIGTMHKILFSCNICSSTWKVMPNTILNGHGCPNCAISGYKRDQLGYLYFIQIDNFLKVGITNREPKHRYKELIKTSSVIEIKVICGDGKSIYDLEQLVHKTFNHYNPKTLKSGNTECFSLSLKEDILLLLEQYPSN